jgi:hypothetical protein
MTGITGTGGSLYGELDVSNAIGRLGVAYVRKVCAHAHIGFTETSPQEDVLGLDGHVDYDAGTVRLQVKATTRWAVAGSRETLRLTLDSGWAEKWSRQKTPAFLVAVLLGRDVSSWVTYDIGETRVAACALWVRIDGTPADATHIDLHRGQRFTVETINDWGSIVYGSVGMAARSA